MSDNALTKTQPAEMHPMNMLQVAFQKAIDAGGADALAVANTIIEQMAKQRDYEARERFNASLLRIQRTIKPILKSGHGEKPGARYALIEDIDAALNPLLEKEGMTLSFEPGISEKPNSIVVTAVLAQGAYERRYPLEMPADGAGPKGGQVMTRTHATGSAMTYAKRYLKNFIFDIQFKQKDDDGNRAGGKQAGVLEDKIHLSHLENIRNSRDMGELQRCYLPALTAAEEIGDAASIKAFINAKTKRMDDFKKGI